jgi:hypothetical protein
MGLLINGQWRDQWYDTSGSGGRFLRKDGPTQRASPNRRPSRQSRQPRPKPRATWRLDEPYLKIDGCMCNTCNERQG